MKGYIYKIYDNTNGNIYYGSTIQNLSCRIASHRRNYKDYLLGKREGEQASYLIIKNNDFSYCVVEEVICENKWELHNRERFWIENNECINKAIPNQTQKEWYEKNKEIIKEKQKIYNENNKEKRNEYAKKWYENNKEKRREYENKWYENNKEKLKENIICDCGCEVMKCNLTRHKKSKKHLLYLNNI
jgi:hypothetical protein